MEREVGEEKEEEGRGEGEGGVGERRGEMGTVKERWREKKVGGGGEKEDEGG